MAATGSSWNLKKNSVYIHYIDLKEFLKNTQIITSLSLEEWSELRPISFRKCIIHIYRYD
jgi:hypothetical protein